MAGKGRPKGSHPTVVIRPSIAQAILMAWDGGKSPGEIASDLAIESWRVQQFLTRRGLRTRERAFAHTRIAGLSDGEAGYIAGLIDGEGTIWLRWSVARHKSEAPSVIAGGGLRIYNSEEAVLRWVRATVGAGNVHSHARDGKGWRTDWRYEVGGWPACRLFESVLPYLIIKRRRAELFIEFTHFSVGATGRRSRTTVRWQNDLISELMRLNARGRGTGNGNHTGFQPKPDNQRMIADFLAANGCPNPHPEAVPPPPAGRPA